MKQQTSRYLALCVALVIVSTASLGQLTVDATGPIRDRQRNPDSSGGGGVGKKLPLVVTVEAGGGGSTDANGRRRIDFILTNAGKTGLILPISPHPGDLEPPDPNADYAVECLSLYMVSSKGPNLLTGGANLYGSSKVPGTLTTLAPGDSVHILARVALPSQSPGQPTAVLLHAGANLSDETFNVVNGKKVFESHVIGSAYSNEFALGSF
jgi:hypothetical protein